MLMVESRGGYVVNCDTCLKIFIIKCWGYVTISITKLQACFKVSKYSGNLQFLKWRKILF
jgi:hypothetical protein